MARILLVVRRRAGPVTGFVTAVRVLNDHLTPDNLLPRDPLVSCADNAASAIFNPSGAAVNHGCSMRLGGVIEHGSRWYELGAVPPEGSYAIVRVGPSRVELVADLVASRTLWYVMTSEELVASTSQRAIATWLGSFKLNANVVPWMLSTGTLGPTEGWDTRTRRVLPGECITLDRGRWRLETRVVPSSYRRDFDIGARGHIERVAEAVDDVARASRFEPGKWLLPLTGGVDSRGLLTALLRAGRNVRTITWGLSAARQRRYDDASIARRVAEKFRVSNRYFPVDLSPEPRERLLDRFLVAGEGCVELIPPFVDGFSAWKSLHDDGIEGIIRGDQAFGATFVHTARDARNCANLTPLSDFVPAEELVSYALAEQEIPERLGRRQDETLEAWRDRLYEQHRISAFLAGLTALESAYVEVVNPLLFARVLECARRLPDELRTGKRAWRSVVRSRCTQIPFARRPAVMPLQNFVNDTATLELLLAELESRHVADALSPALRRAVCGNLRRSLLTRAARRPRQSARQVLTHTLPFGVRAAVRRYAPAKRTLQPTVLAFRAYIVTRMAKLLATDTKAMTDDALRTASL